MNARKTLRIMRLVPDATLPAYAHPGDAGLDLVANEHATLAAGEIRAVGTGIAIALPRGCEAQIRPRSGLALKHGLSVPNAPGTIDEGYRGEIKVILINHGRTAFAVTPGMKIAQMVIAPVLRVAVREVRELGATARGTGGFGSTGLRGKKAGPALLAALFLAAAALADGPQRLVSPEVSADGRATFRLRAPNAKDVQLALTSFPSATMQRDADGVWSLTTNPLPPDIYSYAFNVDGVSLMDPANRETVPNFIWPGSLVHIPGPADLPWEINDVPHGVLHQHFYHSATVGDDRSYVVYTPPGYEARGTRTYPVLYLLHGYSDDASAWTVVGRAHVILDNLIARKQAARMIVVMPLGYGAPEILSRSSTGPRDPALGRRNVDRFREALLHEVLPAVELQYRARRKRDDRAIAGLSMGGGESLEVGLNALDQFAWIGAFSTGGALFSREFAETFPGVDGRANARLRLLWIACGAEDGLLAGNRKFTGWLTTNGVRHTAIETPGAHTWLVWRRNLAAFLPLLFQPAGR